MFSLLGEYRTCRSHGSLQLLSLPDLHLKQSTAYVSVPLSSGERYQLITTYVAPTVVMSALCGARGRAKKKMDFTLC